MAYLTFTLSDENQNSCFKFIGANTTSSNNTTNLITNNTSLIYSASASDCGEDTCSFYSGPSDSTIIAFGESYESCGSIAYDTTSAGFDGYSGSGESCGSIASSGDFSSGSSFSGSSCSYCC